MIYNAHCIFLGKIIILLGKNLLRSKESVLGQVFNRLSVVSKHVVGSVAGPQESHQTLTECNHGGHLALVLLGERGGELQTIFRIKENGVGAGVRGGQDGLERVSLWR